MGWKNIDILAVISIRPYQDLLDEGLSDNTLDRSCIDRGRESEAQEPIFFRLLTH